MKFALKNFIIVFALFVIFSQKAHAYLDPGTGSMVFQIIIASILTAGYTFKSLFIKIFKKNKDDKFDE